MKKNVIALFLISLLVLSVNTQVLSASIPITTSTTYETVAHWVFSDASSYSSGSLSDNSLKILDQTNRGNDLMLMTQRLSDGQTAADSLSFNDRVLEGVDGALGTTNRSIDFTGSSVNGAYFATVPGELDTEEFMDGYTLEIIFSAKQTERWRAVLGKRGTPNSAYDIRSNVMGQDATNGGSFNIGGQNDFTTAAGMQVTGDLQLTLNNTNIKTHNPRIMNNLYQSTLWSDPYGVTRERMHYAVIRNDGESTTLYLDGLPVLRSDNHNPQPGIDKLDGLGWAVGADYSYSTGTQYNGANDWSQTTGNKLTREEFLDREANRLIGTPNFRGEIQEIRMTKGFLPDSELIVKDNAGLIPDEMYTDKLGNNDETVFLSKPENYNFVFVPDTQYFVQYKRGTDGGSLLETTEFEWIAENMDEHNIIGAAQVGDVTENNSSPRGDNEWVATSKSFEIMDNSRVPYTVLPGNHDWRPNFQKYFPESRSENKGYEFATSETPMLDPVTNETYEGDGFSRYMVVKGGSYHYLIVSTGSPNSGGSSISGTTGAQGDELNWCRAVIRNHPNLPTIVLEHTSGNTVINNLVNPFPQVFMHVWGHLSGSYANWIEPGGDIPNPGYWNIQIDYQSDAYAGNGWIDLFEFDEAADKITIHTYSPWVERKLKESAANSEWWRTLPEGDQKLHAFDVLSLTRYFEDSSDILGYKNTMNGTGLVTGNKPLGRTDGVLALDFDTRFAGLATNLPDYDGREALERKIARAALVLSENEAMFGYVSVNEAAEVFKSAIETAENALSNQSNQVENVLLATDALTDAIDVFEESVQAAGPCLIAPWYNKNAQPENVRYNSQNSATVTTAAGDFTQLSEKAIIKPQNLHLIDIQNTDEEIEITAELDFLPDENQLAAGILFYLDEANMSSITRGFDTENKYISRQNIGESGFAAASQETSFADFKNDSPNSYLKLVKSGETVTGYYRENEETDWRAAFAYTGNEKLAQADTISVGFYAVAGSGSSAANTPAVPATFKGFSINGEIQPFIENQTEPITDLELETPLGKPPVLPETVTVRNVDGSTRDAAVLWDNVSPDAYNARGMFDVKGIAEGTNRYVTAHVTTARLIEETLKIEAKDDELHYLLIMTTYEEDGRLFEMTQKSDTVAAGETVTDTISIEKLTGHSVKSFLWDADTYAPLQKLVDNGILIEALRQSKQ